MSPIGQAGRIRLSPLASVVASSKQQGAGNGNPTGVGGVGPNGTGSNAGDPEQGLDPNEVAAMKQAAAQGDPDAIDWLKAAGIVAGVAGAGVAGTALYHALKNKKAPTPASSKFGASDLAAASKPKTTSTAVVPADIPVTQLRDEHLVHPLPAPEEARVLQNTLKALRRVR